MKQTAVNWLIEQLNLIEWIEDDGLPHIHLKIVEEAKEMEEKQRKDDYLAGLNAKEDIEYYTSTYGSKGSDDHIVDTNEMVSSQTENKGLDWLVNRWKKLQAKGDKMSWNQIIQITELAKELPSSQTEISDKQITKLANEHILYNDSKRQWVIEGMKLYREQLKQRQ